MHNAKRLNGIAKNIWLFPWHFQESFYRTHLNLPGRIFMQDILKLYSENSRQRELQRSILKKVLGKGRK